MKTEFKRSGENKRIAWKLTKLVLAILTFPFHVAVTGSLIWASNFKDIMMEETA